MEQIFSNIIGWRYRTLTDSLKERASTVHIIPLINDWNNEKNPIVIEKVYWALSDPKHPVSIAMARQKTVPEVRIIEGLDK